MITHAATVPLTLEALRSRHGESYKWLVLATVMVGMMASALSMTIVNVAVPDMTRYFAIGHERAQWISAAFMLAMTLSLPLTPWLLQRYGLRRTYTAASALLMVGGVVGGFSGNFPVMISMRALEGVAAGLMQPIPNVVILRGFRSHEQGQAMGVFGFGYVLAPAVGPTVGGLLIEHLGWRAIFFMVVPFCLAALVLTRRYLPTVSSFIGDKQSLDWVGLGCLSVGTLALLNGLVGLHGSHMRGAVALIALGATILTGFAIYQLRARTPLLHLRLFTHRQFAVGAAVCFIYGIGLFGSTYLVPIFLQLALGYSPSMAGMVLMPAGFALALTMPIAGRLADRVSLPPLVAVGLALMAGSLVLMARVGPLTAFLTLIAWAILGRLGLGIALPALNIGAIRGLSRAEIPQAASVISFLRQLGGAIGVGFIGMMLEWRLAAHDAAMSGLPAGSLGAFGECFAALAAIVGVAAIAAWFMKPRSHALGGQ
jgi:MFS transporter, DHA2 family, multidrug resistance protein